MPSFFGFSDAWSKHERQVRADGGPIREGVERIKETAAELRDGDTGKVVKTRLRKKDSALGIDSTEFHHSGDRIVTLAEIPNQGGDIDLYYQRYGPNGESRGTYHQRWDKTGDGQHTARLPKRIFTF